MARAPHLVRAILGILALTAAALLAGCAAGKAFDRGQQAMAHGQYDAAVGAFQEAADRAPDKAEYQSALRQAREFASRAHLDLATAAADSHDLATAEKEARTAWAFASTDPVKALMARITQDQADARAQRDTALQLMTSKAWDDALAAMAKATAIDRSLPGAASDVQRIKDSAARDFTARGEAALAAGVLAGAEANARQALVYVPNYPGGRNVLQAVSNRREATRLLETARALLQQGRQAEALAQLLKADDLNRGDSAISAALTETRTTLARQFAAQYQQSVQAQQWGKALALGLLANGYAPGSIPAADVGANAERIRQRIAFRLALAGVAPADDKTRAAALALAGTLTERLLAAKAPHAVLLDRAALDKVAAENRLNPDLTDPQSAAAAAKLAGVSALVTGQILDASVTTTAQRSTGIAQFQSGTTWVANPPYTSMVQARDEAAHHVDEAKHHMDDCHLRLREIEKMPPPPPLPPRDAHDRPEDRKRMEDQAHEEARKRAEMHDRAEHEQAEAVDNLRRCVEAFNAAQAQLEQTPALVELPVISDFQFPIDTVTRRGSTKLKVQAIDPATGEVLLAQTLDGSFSAADRTVQADPAHNVAGDPLELPDEATVWSKTLDDLAQKLSAPAAAVAGLQCQKLITQARREHKANQADAAIEHYLDFLFAAPPSAPERNEAQSALGALLPHEERLAPLSADVKKLMP